MTPPDRAASPEALHASALEALLRGDTAGGITDLKSYLAAEPDDADAWLELGTAYEAIEHWPDAARALQKAVELDGNVVDARLAYARALVRLGKLDDAAFQLLQATKLDERDGRVLRELGVVLYDRRLYDKAAMWLQRACDADPKDARAAYALGLAHEARRDLAAAVVAFREAIRRDGSLLDARSTLADALASLGEHEAAVRELEELLSIDRTNEKAAHNREVLLRALDEMRARRLLGKTERELETSAFFEQAALVRRGESADADGRWVRRYGAPLVELWATFDAGGTIASLLFALTSPERAARAEDDAFRVTVIGKDGRSDTVDYATAASLTFLREALGCPMTHASTLYARLLAGESVEWGGATARFATLPSPDKPEIERHGILLATRDAA